jgi:hypothetical protein
MNERKDLTNIKNEKKLKPAKKPYVKPQVIYRAPLEAMASVCPPAAGGKRPGPCFPAYS